LEEIVPGGGRGGGCAKVDFRVKRREEKRRREKKKRQL